MSPRSIRRAAERQAAKQARKQASHEQASIKTGPTGPRTAEGKAVSCRNHTKHGLTGSFRVLGTEPQELFDELRDTLRAEHAPSTPTEFLLVDRMAEHVWLSQRAQRLQDAQLIEGTESMFALLLRYQTMHDRAFHKCLAELRTLRRERAQQREEEHHPDQPEFESQNTKTACIPPEADSESPVEADCMAPQQPIQAYPSALVASTSAQQAPAGLGSNRTMDRCEL